ncbi:MAG: PKD domain-containing protein, partial [Chitinophagaceae bacterium]
MKKRKITYLLCLVVLTVMSFSTAGCKKTTEKALDCFGESLLTSVHVHIITTNAKQINTEVRYAGSKTISNVKWEFGDGAVQTTTGLTSNHTYAVAGNYT